MQFIRPETSHEKSITEIQSALRAGGMFNALRAFNYARELHDGMRKGGNAPEFSHQVFIANFARTLSSSLLYPEDTLAAIFLHDTPEDKSKTHEEIEERFGRRVRAAVEAMTKKYQGIIIPYPVYFERIGNDPIASIGKGIDRCHNILTMSDAEWTVDKQEKYLIDITDWFLPMLKAARKNFPEQHDAYENIKSNLLIQCKHIELILNLRRKYENTPLTGTSVGGIR